MRKIAIVGFSGSSREDAPFDDTSFEIWGMNNLHSILPGKRFTRWFDMHQRDFIDENNENLSTDHIEWLMTTELPVYMLRHFEEFPTSIEYPLGQVQERMRKEWGFEPGEENYFHSTFAYPIALALLEGVDEIHVYGIDMVKASEYSYQRPNAEGWIALARQQPSKRDPRQKVRVLVAPKCALLKGPGLYGYEDANYALPMKFERAFLAQVKDLERQKADAFLELNAAQRKFNSIDGYLQCANYWLGRMGDVKRGAEP